jgi:hypothetical protein
LLQDYDYCPAARDAVWRHIVANGTLEGSAIDREDMGDAEMVYIESLAPVPLDSDAWDRDAGVLFDVAMLAEGNHPWPIPTTGDDDREAFDRAMDALEDFPAPVAGGAPFEPSPADLEDYHRWSEGLDRRREEDGRNPLYGYE